MALFTTEERAALQSSLMVAADKRLLPFSRDRLFTSIHDSCRHRASSVDDATALTQTIISELTRNQAGGVIPLADITRAAYAVLQRFDLAAATAYAAYHPTAKSSDPTTS